MGPRRANAIDTLQMSGNLVVFVFFSASIAYPILTIASSTRQDRLRLTMYLIPVICIERTSTKDAFLFQQTLHIYKML